MKLVKVIFAAAIFALIGNGVSLPQTRLQGGDTFDTAFPIPEIPFSDSGTTVGYANDYVPRCNPGNTAPDVFYSFTPPYDMVVAVSLCYSTNFDTILHIAEDDPYNVVGCNDDRCLNHPYASSIECIRINTGHIYYFIIDGYGNASGNYSLDITYLAPGFAIMGQVLESGGGPLSGVNIRVLHNESPVSAGHNR